MPRPYLYLKQGDHKGRPYDPFVSLRVLRGFYILPLTAFQVFIIVRDIEKCGTHFIG